MFAALNLFINIVLTAHLQQVRCIYHFTDTSNNILQVNSTVFPLVIHQASTINSTILMHNCGVIVISENDPGRILEKIESKFKYECCMKYNSARKYLIFVRNDEEAQYVFASNSLDFIANLIVIKIQDDDSCSDLFLCTKDVSLEIFTNKFVGNENTPVLLDMWFSRNSSFLYGRNLFPDKINNQQGRNFTISSFTFLPYSNFDNFEGSELTLVYEYAKTRNTTVIFKEKSTWGEVYENFTGTGLMGALIDDEADIVFNGLFLWNYSNTYFDVSHEFMHPEVSCIAPPPKILISWTFILPRIYFPFLLIIIFTSMLLVIIFTINSIFFCKETLDFFDFLNILMDNIFLVLKIQLQQSLSNIKHMSYRIRFNILTLFLMSVIITSKYSSGLSSVITVPNYYGAIDYPIDMATHNLKWQARDISSWTEFIQNDETDIFVRIRENIQELDTESDVKFQVGYVIEKLISGLYSVDLDIDIEILKLFKIMKSYIYTGSNVFFLRKNSIYLPSFNTFLLHAQQAGLGEKWETDVIFIIFFNIFQITLFQCILNTLGFRRQSALTHESFKLTENLKLRFVHIRGIIWVWFGGCVLSFTCFLVEIVTKKNNEKKLIN